MWLDLKYFFPNLYNLILIYSIRLSINWVSTTGYSVNQAWLIIHVPCITQFILAGLIAMLMTMLATILNYNVKLMVIQNDYTKHLLKI